MFFRFVGDCQIPLACKMFLDSKGHELIAKNLYRNFVLHMCSLFDFGLVSPVTLYNIVDRLHKMMKDKEIDEMQKSWQAQHEHWVTHGRNGRPAPGGGSSGAGGPTGTPGRRRQDGQQRKSGAAPSAPSATPNGTPNGGQGDVDPAKRKNSLGDKSPGNASRSKRSWKGVRFCVAVS